MTAGPALSCGKVGGWDAGPEAGQKASHVSVGTDDVEKRFVPPGGLRWGGAQMPGFRLMSGQVL